MPIVQGIDYDLRWEQARIPLKFRGLGLGSYQPTHHTGEFALREAKKFIDNFGDHYVSKARRLAGDLPEDRSNIGRGMLLSGSNGVRKTTLAAALATEVQWLDFNNRVYMTRFSDYKEALTNTFESGDSELKQKSKEVLVRALRSTLLVLDDIGQEHRTSSGFTESTLHELIRKRVEAGLPTVITTNIDPDDMYGVYGKSFDSFRREAFQTLEMLGADSRKNYKD
jgi:DNA replication protein DnaC